MKKVIKVELSEAGIDKVIQELKEYKKWIQECTSKFVSELANEGVSVGTIKFQNAVYAGTNDVTVTVQSRSDTKVAVVAIGSAALFIEFGTGVTQPDGHPEQQFTRGGYGYHLGRLKKGWRYKGDPGNAGEPDPTHPGYIHTMGNPSNMSMYLTVRELEQKFEEIARRCFV